jgi:hypothetical protein
MVSSQGALRIACASGGMVGKFCIAEFFKQRYGLG